MKRILLSAILLGSLVTTASAATGVLSQKNLSVELADKIAQSTLQACAKDGYNVAVTLVDRSGTPLLMKRMDNAGPHTVEASRMKAFTALTTKNATSNVMKGSQSNAGAANLRDIPGFLLLAGGVPVKMGNQVIGAVGVGGAPGEILTKPARLPGCNLSKASLTRANPTRVDYCYPHRHNGLPTHMLHGVLLNRPAYLLRPTFLTKEGQDRDNDRHRTGNDCHGQPIVLTMMFRDRGL